MSLTENGNGMVMPVGPMYGNSAGYGGYDGGLFWIIVLFLFAAMNGNGWGYGNNGGSAGNEVQRVVDQQTLTNGQQNILQALGATQTALSAQLNGISMAQQNCCCENRAAVADVKFAVAQEAAATRSNTDAKVQAVMDKLCQLEMDGIKQNYENRIAGMQNQIDTLRASLNDANRAALDNAQTARILADNANQTVTLEQYLAPTARPAYIVQNPNCCQPQTFGCGCGAV